MERITHRIPEEDLYHLEILVQAGVSPNRSEGIRKAVKEYIESAARRDGEVKDHIVKMYLNDSIEFDELERFLGYEEAKKVRDKTGGE